jgi:hypothetical protein
MVLAAALSGGIALCIVHPNTVARDRLRAITFRLAPTVEAGAAGPRATEPAAVPSRKPVAEIAGIAEM